ncbi:MAG TPA: UPF0182 family protein [Acidimicrobiales bacterium]|nr:UPF0182 family protein [Acidimicrobiales bacterium]
MRASNDRPRPTGRRLSRGRIIGVLAVVIFVVVLLSLRGIAGFWTDYLWFGSVHLTSVWTGVVATKVELAVVFTAIFFFAALANLVLADRLAPVLHRPGPDDEFVQRYRAAIGPHAGKVRVLVALVLALLVGTGASAQWNKWLLFRNAVHWGQSDPQFHKDIGFYVFRLPFYQFLVSWAFFALVVLTLLVVVAHYLNGGIRPQQADGRVTSQVKLHVSVLLGLIALLKAVGYYLQRFELDFSTRGVVQGATYTDVHAQLPALTLLILISLVAAALLLYNVWQKGWVLPVIAVGLWAFVSFIVGVVYPAVVQKFRVQPAENALEKPYIAKNISATRAAFGLNKIQVTQYPFSSDLSATDLNLDAATIRNIRLWDPSQNIAGQTYQKLQEIKSYYQFSPVGVDRYNLKGQETQTLIAVRQLNPGNLPAQGWVNQHLQYTHGYGAVLSPANGATTTGDPVFDIQNIPPSSAPGAPQITQPRVYFGLGLSGYVMADTRTPEIDYQDASGANVTSTYRGSGGVPLGGFVRRAAFALRFGDINPLISGQLTSSSRVIYYRDIQQRVSKAAPFLQLDSDPYAAIVGGHLVWIQDAYTTTANYPYGQMASVPSMPSASGLAGLNYNYVRNSVKVVIDAYSGAMNFYLSDPTDPIIRAYETAFPKLFTPMSSMPSDLRAHLRYPEDMFRAQSALYGRYHITNAGDFYNAANAWDIAQSAGEGNPNDQLAGTPTTNQAGQIVVGPQQRMDPQYLLMRLPNQTTDNFILLEAFVPTSQGDKQQNLSALMVADSDPAQYGHLQVYEMPPGQLVDGPGLVDATIAAAPNISETLSLLNQQGSQVLLGNVLVIPVQGTLVYVRPVYIESTRQALPELQKVIVVAGGNAAMEDTLQAALADVFGSAPATQEQKGAPTTPGTTPSPAATGTDTSKYLQQAAAAYQQAQADLAKGDLGAYQKDVDAMGQAINQAYGGHPPAASSTSTTTTTTLPH